MATFEVGAVEYELIAPSGLSVAKGVALNVEFQIAG